MLGRQARSDRVIFVGVDWAEAHHDVHVADEEGRRLAKARLPEGVSGHEAMVDDDCPCCQMMAELPGPFFWHLDGSGMDDGFAFDLSCSTREEWDVRVWPAGTLERQGQVGAAETTPRRERP